MAGTSPAPPAAANARCQGSEAAVSVEIADAQKVRLFMFAPCARHRPVALLFDYIAED
jgi:hypothetical protein